MLRCFYDEISELYQVGASVTAARSWTISRLIELKQKILISSKSDFLFDPFYHVGGIQYPADFGEIMA